MTHRGAQDLLAVGGGVAVNLFRRDVQGGHHGSRNRIFEFAFFFTT